MEGAKTVEVKQKGAILTVALNRPQVHNALNGQLINDLTTVFREIAELKDVRIVILTGRGRSFCAGADLIQIKHELNLGFDQNFLEGQAIFDMLFAVDVCPLPVIGRVNGTAVGGGVGLISCCDIVIASEKAKFGFSEIRLGLLPAVISPFVIEKIGAARARELFLTGERFSAHFAKEIGLVQYVVSGDELDARVDERVQQLMKGSPSAQSDAKKLIQTVRNKSKTNVRKYTSEFFAQRLNSDEGREGIQAYLEKRKPDWQE